jgi:hypothetical protein
MGKRGQFGWHVTGPAKATRGCVGCRRPIVYGDRCPTCAKRLRLRQRRKLKR